MKKFDEYEIISLTSDNPHYPKGMRKNIKKPILYCKGNIALVNALKNVAVIGARKASENGLKSAHETGRILAERQVTLVNGLALGCDTEAMKGALSVGGKCIAVMPCGLDQVYPKSNYCLAEKILDNGGCLISEYPVGNIVKKYQYVERDKIQSEISDGVIIIEADENSGTMHTDDFTIKQYKRLACYYYKLMDLAKGNQLLENTGKATILKSIEDTKSFIDTVEMEQEFQQLTLWN